MGKKVWGCRWSRLWLRACKSKLRKVLRTIFENLFGGVNLDVDMTLSEFARVKGVRLMFVTTKINSARLFEETIIDSADRTNVSLIKAMAMSSAVPLLFQPVEWNGSIFIDGGICNNYPVKCAYGQPAMSLTIHSDQVPFDPTSLLKSPSEYISILIQNYGAKKQSDPSVQIEVRVADKMELAAWSSALYDSGQRRSKYQDGYQKGVNWA